MPSAKTRINIRVSTEEYQKIKSRATQSGFSVSEYLRRCALRDRDGPTIVVDDSTLKEMLRNLKGIATNINQIAYVVNSRRRTEEILPDLQVALAHVELSADAITQLVIEAHKNI